MDFNINTQGVHNTEEALKKQNNNFKAAIESIYSTINIAKANAWQSKEADEYYSAIVNYRPKLEEIGKAIEYWQNKSKQIADNFENASNNIRNSINNI